MDSQQKMKMNVNKIASQIKRSKRILEAAEKQLNVARESLNMATEIAMALKKELARLEETTASIELLRKDIQTDEMMERSLNDDSLIEMEQSDVDNANE